MEFKFNLRILLGLILAAAIATAGIAALAMKGRQGSGEPRIENKTRSLVIESVVELNNSSGESPKKWRHFQITVRNGYSQAVVAYAFRQQDDSVGKGSTGGVETNGAPIGWTLLPNGTDTTQISVAPEGEVIITLSAVLLEDSTGDGDSQVLSRLRDVRAGVKMAYEQILPILRRAIAGNAAESEAAIQSLRAEIAGAPEEPSVPLNLKRGFYEAKNLVGINLSEIAAKRSSNKELQNRSDVAKLVTRIEEILAKL